jgi:hypothetical protein
VKLRAQPSVTAASSIKLGINTWVNVTEVRSDDWCHVTAEEHGHPVPGFVKCDALTVDGVNPNDVRDEANNEKLDVDRRFTAAQRLLALEPTVASTQTLFATRMFAAEFARLTRTRSEVGSKVQETLPLELAAGASSVAAVEQAVRADHVGAAVTARVVGDDFVAAAIVDDKLTVLSGAVHAGPPASLSIELAYRGPTSPSIVTSLLANDPVRDASACFAPHTNSYGADVCEYEFDQNCSPDRCFPPAEECRRACSAPCSDCAFTCGTQCNACDVRCGDDVKCHDACLAQVDTCKTACATRKEKCIGACKPPEDACERKHRAWWDSTCAAYYCHGYDACQSACAPNDDTCRAACSRNAACEEYCQ